MPARGEAIDLGGRIGRQIEAARGPTNEGARGHGAHRFDLPADTAAEVNRLTAAVREAHPELSNAEWMREAGLIFTPESKVVLEEFRKVYPL